jgi:hypothetical protein
MNFFTWNKAYALFPLSTFTHRKGYLLKEMNHHYARQMAKYLRRGWRTQELLWPEEVSPKHPVQQHRRVGDRYTWILPFNTDGIVSKHKPDYVIEHSSFEIEEDSRPNPVERYYNIQAPIFRSCVTQYEYTYSSDWCEFLGERLDRLTWLELWKLESSERPDF